MCDVNTDGLFRTRRTEGRRGMLCLKYDPSIPYLAQADVSCLLKLPIISIPVDLDVCVYICTLKAGSCSLKVQLPFEGG